MTTRAIILAAGRGSRMQDMTDDQPKCLVQYRGQSLLHWQLTALRTAGITEIAIVTGYRREQLATVGLVEFHNARWQETNMVSSLACAASWLTEQPCIVSYSDIFYDAEAVRSLLASGEALAVTYDVHWRAQWERRFDNPLLDAESFRLTADGYVAEIGNAPDSIDDIEGQYMGLLRIWPDGWREMVRVREAMAPTERDRVHMTGTLSRIIDAGRVRVAAVPYMGAFAEIDSQADLRAADDSVRASVLPSSSAE